MNMALAGLVILVIGDSHMAGSSAGNGRLLTNLHDQLGAQGAVVHSYGMCGAQIADWVVKTTVLCLGEHHDKSPPTFDPHDGRPSWNLNDLIERHHPNLVVVEMGDTVASYGAPALPKPWVYNQAHLLTTQVSAKKLPCIWVGPTWGPGSTSWHKDPGRTKEVSQFLAESVAPCSYVDSTAMSKPGDWPTTDGYHLTTSGYARWGSAITEAVVRWRTQLASK